MIYFIGNRELDVCKIGFSERPKARIKAISSSLPFDVETFHIMNGGRELEKDFHDMYSSCWIKGEWFRLSGIKEIREELQLSSIDFCNEVIVVDGDGYLNLRDVIKVLNKNRVLIGKKPFNVTNFFKREDIEILLNEMKSRFGEGVKTTGIAKYIHPIIFNEMCFSSDVKSKVASLKFLFES